MISCKLWYATDFSGIALYSRVRFTLNGDILFV